MRSRVVAGTVLALALAAAGCSGEGKDAAAPSDPGSSGSATSSASSTPSTSAAISGSGGRVLLVPADSPGTGRCSPAPRRGVVCSSDGRTTYRFQPGAVRTLALQTATGEDDPKNGWQLQLLATPAGARTLAGVTASAARTRQLVLLLTPGSRRLVAAPQVNQAITDGRVQISGDLTESQVRRIVRQVTSARG